MSEAGPSQGEVPERDLETELDGWASVSQVSGRSWGGWSLEAAR